MNKLPPRLTGAQTDIVKSVHSLPGGFILGEVNIHPGKWTYYLTRDMGHTFNKGLPIKYPQTIKALIRKGVLIPEVDDKEFEVQFALGVVDWRVYNLAEEFDKC